MDRPAHRAVGHRRLERIAAGIDLRRGPDQVVPYIALADGLAAATGESVHLEVRDGLKPGIVRGESDEFTYLVMPVRLPTPVG